MDDVRILKFGGTSVATADAVGRVVEIVRRSRHEASPVVVVSALGGVTRTLVELADDASRRSEGWEESFGALRRRHFDLVSELGLDAAEPPLDALRPLFDELHELLRGVHLLREVSPRAGDGIVSYGERLSSRIVAAALADAGVAARPVDARRLVVTDDTFGRAVVEKEATYENLRRELSDASSSVPVVTGFLGATAEGHTTTLGRGGSDYTAALVGAALGAAAIELWTDVDGVLSADPRQVPGAFLQPELSYAELMEMSHFGAKVVHPPSIHPARAAGIPLWIRNTFHPEAAGTVVRERVAEEPAESPADDSTEDPAEAAARDRAPIRGITSIPRVALLRLEGDGMVGVPGIAQRLFGALAGRRVSVILISQSSSEHSICFAVAPEDAETARRAADGEFELERRLGLVDPLVVETDHSVLAAVGEEMAHRPGIAGRLFGVLGEHGVNVRAIAQGSSELNVSLVVESRDEARAVRAIHGAFFHPQRRRVEISLAGVGRVGGAFLEQLAAARRDLYDDEGLDLRLRAVATSRRMLIPEADPESEGLDPETVRGSFGDPTATTDLDADAFLDAVAEATARPPGRRIFVDATAAEIGPWYPRLLRRGVAVVAANKKPLSASLSDYREILQAARRGRTSLLFEATVGAGLPVVSTLRQLRRTGDVVHRIDAVLSGTLNAVLDRMSAETTFSAAVRSAYDDGLTEPHPYDDLSGLDVQRKLLILARLLDREIEPEEVEVEALLDADPWSGLDVDELWERLPELDERYEARREEAEAAGKVLRYVASLGADGARVGLEAVGPEHAAHGLRGPDNLVAFHSARYDVTPLVVRGPGAGPPVTAAGVFADVLEAARA